MKLQMMTHGQNSLNQGRSSPYYIPTLHNNDKKQGHTIDASCPVDLRQSKPNHLECQYYDQSSIQTSVPDVNQSNSTMSNVMSDDLMLVEEHLRPLIKQELRYSIQSKRIARGLPTTFDPEPFSTQNETPSPETLIKRSRRRERNKVAAAKCRFKKKMISERLQEESEHLEHINLTLKREIQKLQDERQKLTYILNLHRPTCIVRSPAANKGQEFSNEENTNETKQQRNSCSLNSSEAENSQSMPEQSTWMSQTDHDQYMESLLRSPIFNDKAFKQ